MVKARLAFVSLTLGSAAAIMHCSSSDSRPPLSPDEDAATIPVSHYDAEAYKDTALPDAGPANLVMSKSAVDFGLVPCGTTAPPQTVTLTNAGPIPLAISLSLLNGGTAFGADLTNITRGGNAGASITLQPAEQAALRISPKAIPAVSPTTADYYTDTISVTTDPVIPGATFTVGVKQTARGAILAYVPSGADFGAVPVNHSATSDFVIANTGNDNAEITLSSDNPRFTYNKLGPFAVAAANQTPVTATFSAADTPPQAGKLKMTVSAGTTLCSAVPADFTMAGSGSTGAALVSPTSLLFGSAGLVACGTQAASIPVTITNSGNAAFTYTAAFTSGASSYTMSPTTGTVQANGGQAVIQIQPNPIPQVSPVTPELYSGSVSVTTDAVGDSAHIVQLHQTAKGVILTSSNHGALDFGGVSVNQTATQQFNITNAGNVDAQLNLNKANPVFGFANTLPIAIGAGQNAVPVVTFTPKDTTTYTDTITMNLASSTTTCGPLPANIALSGNGTSGVGTTPSELNFGNVQCGSPAPAGQAVTIANLGNACTYTATFGRGVQNLPSYYALSDAPTGGNAIATATPHPLGAGSSITLYVAPTAIVTPASTATDAFSDVLTFTTTCAGDSKHIVLLHETAQGAVLAMSPIPFPYFGKQPQGTFQVQPLSVSNAGNLAAQYSLALTIQHGVGGPTPGLCQTYTGTLPSFCINYGGGSIFAGQTQAVTVESTSDFAQSYGFITLTPDPSAVLCSDPVPNLPISTAP